MKKQTNTLNILNNNQESGKQASIEKMLVWAYGAYGAYQAYQSRGLVGALRLAGRVASKNTLKV